MYQSIAAQVTSFTLQNIPFDIELSKADVKFYLEKIIKMAFQKNAKLKDKVSLVNLDSIYISNDTIKSEALLHVHNEDSVLPGTSKVEIILNLDWNLENDKIFINNLKVTQEVLEANNEDSIKGGLQETSTLFNEEVIADVKTQINEYLQHPNSLMQFISPIMPNLDSVDYQLLNLSLRTEDNFYKIKCTPNIYGSEGEIDKGSDQQYLYLEADEAGLKPHLLKLVNEKLTELVDFDIRIDDADIVGVNTVYVAGGVEFRGMHIPFELISDLVFDKTAQAFKINIQQMETKGGFLIRNAFKIMKQKITSMIESKSSMTMASLLEKLPIKISNEHLKADYELDVEQFDVETIEIAPRSGKIIHRLILKDALFKLALLNNNENV